MVLVHLKMSKRDDEIGLLNRRTASSNVEFGDDSEDEEQELASGELWPHVFNMMNSIIGVSVLAMPYVFQQCGILLSSLMIALCAVLTKLTCHCMVVSAYNTRANTYEGLAKATLGPSGRRLCELCLLFFLFSSIVAFMVVIGDIGPHILAEYLELEAPTQRLRVLVMVLVTIFIILPLSTITDMHKFSVISSIAVVFYAVFVVRMLLEAIPKLYEGQWSIHVVWWRPEGFLTCLPIVCMAQCCQTQLFPVLSCIKNASTRRVDSVVASAVNVCSAMYAAVGVFGYVAFYNHELHGDVLVQLPPTLLTQLLKLAFLLSIAVSIPLMLFPARTALFFLLLKPAEAGHSALNLEKSTFHVLTVVVIFSNLGLAILVPNVEFILGLTGSFIGSLVSTIIPCTMFLFSTRDSMDNRKNNRPKVSTFSAKVCLVAGIFILVASTAATLSAEQKSAVVEKPMPKDQAQNKPVLKSLERLEERVLDANLNISAKLENISNLAASGNDTEAVRMLVEMRQQQKEQQELIEKQGLIVAQLNKEAGTETNQTEVLVSTTTTLTTTTTTTTKPPIDHINNTLHESV